MGTAVGLLVLEIVLRTLDLQPARYGAPDWYAIPRDSPSGGAAWDRPDRPQPHKRPSTVSRDILPGEFVPGIRIRMVYPSNPRGYFDRGNGVEFAINRLGLRGPEISVEKPRGTFRVLGLGDSFTFGEGVREEDTFLRRLERRFNEGQGGSPRFEFLNAACGGYNTADEVLYLERKWLALAPDVVLIVFYLNDAYNHETIMEMGEDVGANLTQPSGLARWSLVWDHVQHRVATRRQAKRIERFYRAPFFREPGEYLPYADAAKADWRRTRAGFRRAAEIAEEAGLGIGLVLFPMLYELDDDHPFTEVHRFVAAEAERLGIPVLDLLPAFRGRDAKDLWVHPGDHHPNERAHAIAADEIEVFLNTILESMPPQDPDDDDFQPRTD
ncbi:MAG: hypothetical protein DHS20C21_14700 [Gemmatimonadota bacterium]|nr:MAG: hypothetical protein DHS20C21_14700 [Gemmatimonadota bacterium]